MLPESDLSYLGAAPAKISQGILTFYGENQRREKLNGDPEVIKCLQTKSKSAAINSQKFSDVSRPPYGGRIGLPRQFHGKQMVDLTFSKK